MIDLLPALPTVWKSGTITGLRARGGFGVDLTWKNGSLTKAVVSSKAGGKANIRNCGKIHPITIPPGGTAELTPSHFN